MQGEKYLFVVSGPSGTGKDTIVARLLETHPEITRTISATTRSMREGEKDGVNYYFVTREEFEGKLQRDEIVERQLLRHPPQRGRAPYAGKDPRDPGD